MSQSFTNREVTPFRYDIVGSFLRPRQLKEAREKFHNKEISALELRAVEDQEIIRLIAKQKQVGLKAVTDGEFRRSWWHLDYMWGFHGIDKFTPEEGYIFKGFVTRAETARVSGKISFNPGHPFLEHFMFLKEAAGEDVIARQAIPAPAQILHEILRGDNRAFTDAVYEAVDQVVEDLAQAYRQTILAFYDAGCRSIQLDDTTWGVLLDPKIREQLESKGGNADQTLALYAKINELATTALPDDLVVTTHVCRGNFRSTYLASGSYNTVADAYFSQPNYDAFYLEFDTDRAGSFEVLKGLRDRKVVLGLVSSKTGELEDRQYIINRIHEAAQYVNLDDICISPQCGFASTEEGNLLTEEEQWKKLAFIRDIAKEVWN